MPRIKPFENRHYPRRYIKCITIFALIIFSALLIKMQLQHLEPQQATSVKSKFYSIFEFGREPVLTQKCPEPFQLNTSNLTPMVKMEQQSMYNAKDHIHYTDKVLILTPVSNSGSVLKHYFQLLCSLSYPHNLITIAIGEDSSQDKTFEIANFQSLQIKDYFRNVQVFKLHDNLKDNSKWDRHGQDWQLVRRTHLAKSRNQLLFNALSDETWILWIDSDVKYFPPDLIQHLLATQKDIVVPSCMYKLADDSFAIYDRNTWQETEKSRNYLKNLPSDQLVLEGYSPTKRIYLAKLKEKVVPLDGVGGCALLVRAECHKKGLVFPAFVFQHQIETEGLAKMARQMNFSVYGLPRLWVFHS